MQDAAEEAAVETHDMVHEERQLELRMLSEEMKLMKEELKLMKEQLTIVNERKRKKRKRRKKRKARDSDSGEESGQGSAADEKVKKDDDSEKEEDEQAEEEAGTSQEEDSAGEESHAGDSADAVGEEVLDSDEEEEVEQAEEEAVTSHVEDSAGEESTLRSQPMLRRYCEREENERIQTMLRAVVDLWRFGVEFDEEDEEDEEQKVEELTLAEVLELDDETKTKHGLWGDLWKLQAKGQRGKGQSKSKNMTKSCCFGAACKGSRWTVDGRCPFRH